MRTILTGFEMLFDAAADAINCGQDYLSLKAGATTFSVYDNSSATSAMNLI
jgi:hypothetical protein